MQKLLDDTVAILTAPFVGKLDLVHLFLIVGLVIVFATAWFFIINHMATAAREVI